MKAVTYKGIKGEYLKDLHSEGVTFYIEGTNELTEDFYSCEVYGRINNNWINVEKTDSYNCEYDNLVQRMIQEMAKPYFLSFE